MMLSPGSSPSLCWQSSDVSWNPLNHKLPFSSEAAMTFSSYIKPNAAYVLFSAMWASRISMVLLPHDSHSDTWNNFFFPPLIPCLLFSLPSRMTLFWLWFPYVCSLQRGSCSVIHLTLISLVKIFPTHFSQWLILSNGNKFKDEVVQEQIQLKR